MLLISLPSNWNSEVENGQHFSSHFLDKEISNDCGCDCGIAGLPYTNQTTHDHEQPKHLKA